MKQIEIKFPDSIVKAYNKYYSTINNESERDNLYDIYEVLANSDFFLDPYLVFEDFGDNSIIFNVDYNMSENAIRKKIRKALLEVHKVETDFVTKAINNAYELIGYDLDMDIIDTNNY